MTVGNVLIGNPLGQGTHVTPLPEMKKRRRANQGDFGA